jgi:mitochondrial fission protein ELM1
MNILWIKDGKQGHEKQVKVLIDELSKSIDINLIEQNYKTNNFSRLNHYFHYLTNNFFNKNNEFINLVNKCNQNNINLVIGAGSSVHISMLLIKKYFKSTYQKNINLVSILVPSLFHKHFDVICAPLHDEKKLANNENIIYFQGSLAKVSIKDVDENIGLIALGGVNKHYDFDEVSLLKQIQYILTLYPEKKWFLFDSRRTPKNITKEISKLKNEFSNLTISERGFDDVLEKASIKFITQDSVNMVYEALSTRGKTYLFNMNSKKENKITRQMDLLITNKQLGYIEKVNMAEGLEKIKIQSQNPYHEVFSEVEKVAYQLIKKLNLNSK